MVKNFGLKMGSRTQLASLVRVTAHKAYGLGSRLRGDRHIGTEERSMNFLREAAVRNIEAMGVNS